MFIAFLVLIGFLVPITLLVFGYVLGVRCILTNAHVANVCWLSTTIIIHHVVGARHIHGACHVDFHLLMANNTPTLALPCKLKLHWNQKKIIVYSFNKKIYISSIFVVCPNLLIFVHFDLILFHFLYWKSCANNMLGFVYARKACKPSRELWIIALYC
jgi:hypothetical protein